MWSVKRVTIRSNLDDLGWSTLAPSAALSLIFWFSAILSESRSKRSAVAWNDSAGRKNIYAIGLNPRSVAFLGYSLNISDTVGFLKGATVSRSGLCSNKNFLLWLGFGDCGLENTFMSSKTKRSLSFLSGFCDNTDLISSCRLKKNSGDLYLSGKFKKSLLSCCPLG